MTAKKIVVDTSIIAEHLTTKKDTSVLRRLLHEYFCYTTVFNAIELFAAARSLKETQAVQDAMDALKVLGINPKSAKNIATVVSSSTMDFTALIAAVCIESKLPIVTLNPKRFSRIKRIKIVSVKDLVL
ncbi:MAG: PIN domain-containing protein [Bacteroidota bacterium]